MKILKQMASAATLGLTLLLGVGSLSSPAYAGYILTLKEVGTDVAATGSGPLDITGLSFLESAQPAGGIIPLIEFVTAGPFQGDVDLYAVSPIGPSNFGNGTGTQVTSGTGDFIWFRADAIIGVPAGYVSGGPLSSTSLYLNQTFASLGADPGTYLWTWGRGANQNFTLIIGDGTTEPPSIPEPSSVTLLGMGLGVLLLAGAIRRVRTGF